MVSWDWLGFGTQFQVEQLSKPGVRTTVVVAAATNTTTNTTGNVAPTSHTFEHVEAWCNTRNRPRPLPPRRPSQPLPRQQPPSAPLTHSLPPGTLAR